MSEMSLTAPVNSSGSVFNPPSLPKGGGTLTGSSGALSAGGPDGVAGWSIPLPVSAGRGFAPGPALSYSSAAGNSEFGLGWQLTVPAIGRNTRFGVPDYQDVESVNGPDGAELIRAGVPEMRTALPFSKQSGSFRVTRYLSRYSGTASRTEYWEELSDGLTVRSFWIAFSPDGGLALYGWSDNARLADPGDACRIAEWKLEEQVNARGEHILWRWRSENDDNCSEAEKSQHLHVTGCYLSHIHWANITPGLCFFVPENPAALAENNWLCSLIIDYGERNTPSDLPPPYAVDTTGGDVRAAWPVRPDPLSRWHYGFEVRTRRLGREFLLFHRIGLMDGSDDEKPVLVSRLQLTHKTSPVVSWLTSAQIFAYEPDEDDAPVTLPPVEFGLSQPYPLPDSHAWEYRADLEGFSWQYWQMADLKGEGLPGLLYQDTSGWWYRAPQRDISDGAGPDAVTWGAAQKLERIPSLSGWQLMDLDNDGRVEQVVPLPGVTGSFTLDPDGSWNGFVPFSALPAEFMHPQAQLADLTGNGLSDLVMLGPRAVRVWPSDGKRGWKQGVNQMYTGTWPLPAGDDAHRLVLFADLPGSGQQHLTEITAGSVRYWPSLGYGRFGEAITVAGFDISEESFSPDRIFLADTDGSGTPDILYLAHEGLRLFINESGNSFREAGTIPLPDGIRGDGLCTVQVADVQGLGVASVLLTVPHAQPGLSPRTWLLDLNVSKPWLLKEICENTGSRTLLSYRSSAQAWLDEKKARQEAGETPVSYLPFAVHTVSQVTQVNDITGLILGSETRYLGGVWDGKEKEFAGFRQVIQRDTHAFTRGTSEQMAPPAEVRSWFMTGLREHDEHLNGTFNGIMEYPQRPERFMRQAQDENRQEAFVPDAETEAWLRRSLRGALQRAEVYGLDATLKSTTPYTVSTSRWQVCACTTDFSEKPASLVTQVESMTYSCERYHQDPVVSQTIVLRQDRYGAVLESASVSYPRLLSPQALLEEEDDRNIYPASLPEGLIRESTDTQQYDCWIKLMRACVHNLDSETDFATGLPDTARSDVIWYGSTHPEGNPKGLQNHTLPQEGFSVEFLLNTTNGEREIDRLLSCKGSVVLDSFMRTHWRSAEDGQSLADVPDRQALLAFTETAMHDEQSLNVLRPIFEETLRDLATNALSDTCTQDHDSVLCRMRRRLPELPPVILAGEAVKYLQQKPDDSDAITVIRAALKKAVSVNGLSQRLLDINDELLPEPLRLQLKKESRIPDAWLPLVAGWFMHDAVTENAPPALAVSAVEKEAFTSALAAAVPDALFWRMALADAEGTTFTDAQQLLSQKTQAESLESLLRRGGYHPVTVPHAPAVNEAWSGRHSHFTYHDASGYWLPETFRESELVRATAIRYTEHYLAVREATDDISHFTSVERFDWRFITPVRIKDINDNITDARLDALGRVSWARFYGTETPPGAEKAEQAGYSPFRDIVFTPPVTAEDAVALNETKGVPVHEAFTLVTDSWMRQLPDAQGKPSGIRCGELVWRRRAEQLSRDGITLNESDDLRTPPHIIRIQTDRYDDDPEQQVRVQVMLYGGGQLLQTAVLSPPGDALVRTAAGGLKAGDRGAAVSEHATVRWAVTGKTEYDNKGQPVRVWLPFYLNDWRWVSDDSARDGIYADTHVRDATGREYRIIRAAGEDVNGVWANYECRTHCYPWFTVSEDENDTWLEVTEAARRKTLH